LSMGLTPSSFSSSSSSMYPSTSSYHAPSSAPYPVLPSASHLQLMLLLLFCTVSHVLCVVPHLLLRRTHRARKVLTCQSTVEQTTIAQRI
jgi:hypothetical protein